MTITIYPRSDIDNIPIQLSLYICQLGSTSESWEPRLQCPWTATARAKDLTLGSGSPGVAPFPVSKGLQMLTVIRYFKQILDWINYYVCSYCSLHFGWWCWSFRPDAALQSSDCFGFSSFAIRPLPIICIGVASWVPLDVGTSLAQAYVQYKSEDSVQRALEWHNTWQLWIYLTTFLCSAESRVSVPGMVPTWGWVNTYGTVLGLIFKGRTWNPLEHAWLDIWAPLFEVCPAGYDGLQHLRYKSGNITVEKYGEETKGADDSFLLQISDESWERPQLWVFSLSFSCTFLAWKVQGMLLSNHTMLSKTVVRCSQFHQNGEHPTWGTVGIRSVHIQLFRPLWLSVAKAIAIQQGF